MRFRALVMCAMGAMLLCLLPEALPGPGGQSAEGARKRVKKDKKEKRNRRQRRARKEKKEKKDKCRACKRRNQKNKDEEPPPPPPPPEPPATNDITLSLESFNMGFAFVNGINVPTFVEATIYDANGNAAGIYVEQFTPVWDENLNLIGFTSTSMWMFNVAGGELSGTLHTSNATMITGVEFMDPFEFLSLETFGDITDATGDLAGMTGSFAMTTTAVFHGALFLYDANVTLSLPAEGG